MTITFGAVMAIAYFLIGMILAVIVLNIDSTKRGKEKFEGVFSIICFWPSIVVILGILYIEYLCTEPKSVRKRQNKRRGK